MDTNRLVKYLIAFIIIIVVGFFVYKKIFFQYEDHLTNGNQADGSGPQQAFEDMRFFGEVKSLDPSIFNDPKFKSLRQNVIIKKRDVKKGNKNIFKSD